MHIIGEATSVRISRQTTFSKLNVISGDLQVALDFRLDLPQVAVIGSQSSGKSSVLEALVRR